MSVSESGVEEAPRPRRGRPPSVGLAERRREQLTDAAFTVFAEQGYEQASVADIAAEEMGKVFVTTELGGGGVHGFSPVGVLGFARNRPDAGTVPMRGGADGLAIFVSALTSIVNGGSRA